MGETPMILWHTEFTNAYSMESQGANLPLVVAVVPAFNRCDKTLRFLRQFPSIDYPNKRVVICDDGSTDNTYHNIRLNFPEVEVLRGNGNLWWSGGTNLAIQRALEMGADYILTINDDAIMEGDFLKEMVAVARQNPKFIVGCRIHREDHPDRIWSIGTSPVFKGYNIFALNFWDKRWAEIQPSLPNPYPVVTMPGNGVLIPRAVFSDVGYFDQKYMPQYHADSDLILRARKKGYQPVISLNSVLYNHILTVPLVNDRWNLIFNKKSDRYWKAVWATLRRHGPLGKRIWLLMMQYVPFFVPQWAVRLYRRLRPPAMPKTEAGAV
jgi:GT2 family glycosyltransferase